MDPDSPFELFLRSRVAAGITNETARAFRREARELEVGPRERVPPGSVTFIAQGHAKCVVGLPSGRDHAVTFAWPGTLVLHAPGESAALSAIGTCRIVGFAAQPFFEIVNSDPIAGGNVLRELADQVQRLRGHAAMIARLSARERLLAFLTGVGRERGVEECGCTRLPLPMSRADMADHLGLTIETTSRCMMQLQREGLIACPSRKETVLLPPAQMKARSGIRLALNA